MPLIVTDKKGQQRRISTTEIMVEVGPRIREQYPTVSDFIKKVPITKIFPLADELFRRGVESLYFIPVIIGYEGAWDTDKINVRYAYQHQRGKEDPGKGIDLEEIEPLKDADGLFITPFGKWFVPRY